MTKPVLQVEITTAEKKSASVKAGSSCIDAGNNLADFDPGDEEPTPPLRLDIGELPRIADGNGDTNAVIDMGPHELRGS